MVFKGSHSKNNVSEAMAKGKGEGLQMPNNMAKSTAIFFEKPAVLSKNSMYTIVHLSHGSFSTQQTSSCKPKPSMGADQIQF